MSSGEGMCTRVTNILSLVLFKADMATGVRPWRAPHPEEAVVTFGIAPHHASRLCLVIG